MIKDICPYCEKISNLEFIKQTEEVVIKGILTNIDDQFYVCTECGGAFDNPRDEYDILEVIKKVRNQSSESKSFITKNI